ncbi:DHHA1 domain-containing protein [Pontibacillus salicampi]|uniref:DHHA1 domain-containing protein n=1 Tax=Pontibacillus salicampi TaxID=1449801 RepID=A0ABV6LQD8_9BACI
MTRKLFYEDAYVTEFTSEIIRSSVDEENRAFVILKETAFYPTGGGQPHDTGMIGDREVHDVEEVNGEVRHYITEPWTDDTLSVIGKVNWERRLDHMQQHSGQHILSAVMQDHFGLETVSFHLGTDTVSIDLATESLTMEVLKEAEAKVNKIIQRHDPIETKWVTVDVANEYPLRKKLAVEDDVRLVIIPEVDYNGCGGTHPRNTAEVMSLKLLGWTRQKRQVRLEFVCGYRVLEKLGEKHHVLNELKQVLRRPAEELVNEVDNLLALNKQKDKQIKVLENELISFEAKELVGRAKEQNGWVQSTYEGRSIKSLQALGKAIVQETADVLVILVSDQGEQLQFVLARGEEKDVNLKEVAMEVMTLIDGKGGGKPEFVQGGGQKLMEAAPFTDRIREIVQSHI